jgi:hypothetical protein
MPIEVRRVRILKSKGSTIDLQSSASVQGGGTTGAPPMPGGMMGSAWPKAGGTPPKTGGTTSRPAGEKEELGQFDMPVQIQGVIYIYNPPDREKLGTGTASAEKPAETATPAAPEPAAPATSPAAPASPTGTPAKVPAASPTKSSKP